jgi:hypothetical protein
MKGVLSWMVHWACRSSTRIFCFALAALVGPVQLFTLYYLLIQNLALVKISFPSLLVKEQGVGLYSDPTPIYLFVYLSVYYSITPQLNGDIAII